MSMRSITICVSKIPAERGFLCFLSFLLHHQMLGQTVYHEGLIIPLNQRLDIIDKFIRHIVSFFVTAAPRTMNASSTSTLEAMWDALLCKVENSILRVLQPISAPRYPAR